MIEAMARINALQARFAPVTAPTTSAARPTTTRTSAGQDFASVLGAARTGTTRPATATARTAATAGAPPAGRAEYEQAISQIAAEEGVPASLLSALVWSESSYNPDAVSSAGARGLAQLMPGTAAGLGVNIDDPLDNLRGGARYLRRQLDQFGRVDLALAAYNAGPGAVQRHGGIPPYPETQRYVTKVLERAELLERAS